MHLTKSTQLLTSKFKLDLLKNATAFLFVVVGYPLGVWMLFSVDWIINIVGVLLTAEALIISAYLLHELSHWSIFKSPISNERWANIMAWINGSCYSTFKEIRDKHMHHHVDRADVLNFNVQQLMLDMPKPVRNLIKTLEWLYIPALEILMHLLVITLPFSKPEWHYKRLRLLAIISIRAIFLILMDWPIA
jgi:fatty acid desaturase